MYIFLYFVVLINCNIGLFFAILFICFHVYHHVTNASLYLCLFLYVYTYVYVLNVDVFTIHFYYIFNLTSL